jgi:hypothetical protein
MFRNRANKPPAAAPLAGQQPASSSVAPRAWP